MRRTGARERGHRAAKRMGVAKFSLPLRGRLRFNAPMHPFCQDEPKVKVQPRTQAVRLDVIVGLALVLLLGVWIGL